MASDDGTNGDMLKVENAILKLKEELKDHVTEEFRCLKETRCKVNEDDIKKNRMTLVFLIAGGGIAVSGGGYGIIKLLIGG